MLCWTRSTLAQPHLPAQSQLRHFRRLLNRPAGGNLAPKVFDIHLGSFRAVVNVHHALDGSRQHANGPLLLVIKMPDSRGKQTLPG